MNSRLFKRSNIFKYLPAILTVFLWQWQAMAQESVMRPGDLDSTFGTGGKVAINLLPNSSGNTGLRAIIDPNGNIYQFGSTGDGATSRAGVIRLTEQGVPDTTWNDDGIFVGYFPELFSSRFSNGVVQADGKLLAVGSVIKADDNVVYSLLARFLPTGQLDTSFNDIGYTLFRNEAAITVNSYWWNVAVLPTGKIIVSGALNYQMAAARFNADGSLDTTFGTNGYRIIQVSVLGELWDMKIASDGKIVLVGKAETNFNNGNYSDFTLVRLTADGALDATFANGGVQRLDLTRETEVDTEVLYGVRLLADGKILCVGRVGDANNNPIDAVVMRFMPDGQFDTSFGTNGSGFVIVDYNNENNLPQDLAIQADGKIVIAEFNGEGRDFLVQRLLPDGRLDTSFGIEGSVETDLGGNDFPFSVSLTSDKILLAGYCGRNANSIQKLCLARYLQNGQTANTATLKGRAVNLIGRGISGTQISVRNAVTNETLNVTTDRTGNFQLPNLLLAQEYVLTPQARHCYFQQSPMTVNFNNPDTNILLRANCFYTVK